MVESSMTAIFDHFMNFYESYFNCSQEPVWNEKFKFDIVDQYDLKMEVFDKDTFTSDDAIGHTQISLLQVFKKGVVDSW